MLQVWSRGLLLPSLTLPSSSCSLRLLSSSSRLPVRFRDSRIRRSGGKGGGGGVGNNPPQIRLLDKFVKLTSLEGSLIAKAPFGMRVCGVFFRDDNTVDTEKNVVVGAQRERFRKEENLRRREETPEALEQLLMDEREYTQEILETAQLDLEEMQKLQESKENQAAAESSILGDLGVRLGGVDGGSSRAGSRERSPLHMNLYGRISHQVLSYSILAGQNSGTHIFVSDEQNTDKIEKQMFALNDGSSSQPHPAGRATVWGPKNLTQGEISQTVSELEEEEVNCSFKIYSPPHLLEPDGFIKANYLVPTLMNKIYMETEKQGSLELDASLMDQMASVGLASEFGKVKPKDVWAHNIKLATRYGDIECQGTIEGDIWAETLGDGDFIARVLVGPSLRVTTDAGDICLWGDVFSERVELYTVTGHIHVRQLYGRAKCLVKEEGYMNMTVVEGSVDAVVKNGEVILRVEGLVEDSCVEVESGNVVIHLTKSQKGDQAPYRLALTSSRNDLEPRVLNRGEVSLLENGQENFTFGGLANSEGDSPPLLTVRCHHGQIRLREVKPVAKPRPSAGWERGPPEDGDFPLEDF